MCALSPSCLLISLLLAPVAPDLNLQLLARGFRSRSCMDPPTCPSIRLRGLADCDFSTGFASILGMNSTWQRAPPTGMQRTRLRRSMEDLETSGVIPSPLLGGAPSKGMRTPAQLASKRPAGLIDDRSGYCDNGSPTLPMAIIMLQHDLHY